MGYPPPDHQRAVDYIDGKLDTRPLFERAGRIRDEGRGRTITYSPKVFVPITTLCRDVCTYCTFAKPPGAGGEYLTPDDVLAITEAGDAAGCSEALLTLGDRPEERWAQARAFLDSQGHGTTIGYVRAMSELIVEKTGLFPHANPGIMTSPEIEALRPTNVSMGLMLENISPRLMEPGMPHHNCPDKDPAVRMRTIEAAGAARVPFTTGVLVGIGEITPEIVDSLFAIREVHARWGHIQEVIIQNFRAKPDTAMAEHEDAEAEEMLWSVAMARLVLGPDVNLQVPPNLSQRDYPMYLQAGINDWGGVSPLTIDYVNPEAPWPQIADLERHTREQGFILKPRFPVYPEFFMDKPDGVSSPVAQRLRDMADEDGYVKGGTQRYANAHG